MASLEHAMERLQDFFTKKLEEYGPVAKGVDWASPKAQEARFDQLLKIIQNPTAPFSIIDYGCGYGALAQYLTKHQYDFQYMGYDMTPACIQTAQTLFAEADNISFTHSKLDLKSADYLICAGIFNLKLDVLTDVWEQYCLQTISDGWAYCRKGLAVNFLTSYSDAEYMRDDLYYPNPCTYFDFCKTNFAHNVALLHDYDLYDFTILVRR